jgi:hypothetical protein
VVYESRLNEGLFVKEPDCGNEGANDILGAIAFEAVPLVATATSLPVSFWQNKIGHTRLDTSGATDRHISTTRINLFQNAFPITASFCYPLGESRTGNYESGKEAYNIATFKGEVKIDNIVIDSTLFYKIDIDSFSSMKSPAFWMAPGLNKNDGLDEFQFKWADRGASEMTIDHVTLLDGNVLYEGDRLSQKIWGDNGDLFPCKGQITPVEKIDCYFQADYIDPVLQDFNYYTSVSKYSPVYKQPGESSKDKKNMRFRVHQRKKYGMDLTALGSIKPICDLYEYYLTIKRMHTISAKKRAQLRKAAIIERKKRNYRDWGLESMIDTAVPGKKVNLEHIQNALIQARQTKNLLTLTEFYINLANMADSLDELVKLTTPLIRIKKNTSFKDDKFHFVTAIEIQDAEKQRKKREEQSHRTEILTLNYGSIIGGQCELEDYRKEVLGWLHHITTSSTEVDGLIDVLEQALKDYRCQDTIHEIAQAAGDELRVQVTQAEKVAKNITHLEVRRQGTMKIQRQREALTRAVLAIARDTEEGNISDSEITKTDNLNHSVDDILADSNSEEETPMDKLAKKAMKQLDSEKSKDSKESKGTGEEGDESDNNNDTTQDDNEADDKGTSSSAENSDDESTSRDPIASESK